MRRELWPTAERITFGIIGTAFEVAAAEVTFELHVSDDGSHGGAEAQLAHDDTEDAALVVGRITRAVGEKVRSVDIAS
ncbi:hypothetical protein XH94_30640 [Bradyrhizobium zhanjiangense]|uniref:Uncharacterized protein n=1 Tax=Bradyrhizobium zhanjiangense TaxID=1325107 RepID=A0A4V1L2Q2_9BRAD|nr:hypothetical protein XH94_30640 [Bradyrhizobium zhanjiangense]